MKSTIFGSSSWNGFTSLAREFRVPQGLCPVTLVWHFLFDSISCFYLTFLDSISFYFCRFQNEIDGYSTGDHLAALIETNGSYQSVQFCQLLLGAIEIIDEHFVNAQCGRGFFLAAVNGIPVILIDFVGNTSWAGLIRRAFNFASAAQRL